MDLDELLDECLKEEEEQNDDDLLDSIMREESKETIPKEYLAALSVFPEKDRFKIYKQIEEDYKKLQNVNINPSSLYFVGKEKYTPQTIVTESISSALSNTTTNIKLKDIESKLKLKEIIETSKLDLKQNVINKLKEMNVTELDKYPNCKKLLDL